MASTPTVFLTPMPELMMKLTFLIIEEQSEKSTVASLCFMPSENGTFLKNCRNNASNRTEISEQDLVLMPAKSLLGMENTNK